MQDQINELIGKTAAVAYRTILLAHANIQTFTVFRYESPPRLQERVVISAFEQSIIDQALAFRSGTQIPFWESVFNACLLEQRFSDALLTGAFFHNGPGEATVFTRADLEAGILERLTDGQATNVGLGSAFTDAHGTTLHCPMLDFHCDITKDNTMFVNCICRTLMPRGFLIMNSGDSYHAVGIALVSAAERVVMLGKALLVNPVVDAFYIGHQLQQAFSSIRISRGGRAKQFPEVIGAWSPTNA